MSDKNDLSANNLELNKENKVKIVHDVLELRKKAILKHKRNEQKAHIINVVKRQTTYDEKTILEKLELFDNDPTKVIKDYMGIKIEPKKTEKVESVNQEIYSQIRTMLDDGCKEFRRRQEISEYYNNLRNKQQTQEAQNQEAQNQEAQNHEEKQSDSEKQNENIIIDKNE